MNASQIYVGDTNDGSQQDLNTYLANIKSNITTLQNQAVSNAQSAAVAATGTNQATGAPLSAGISIVSAANATKAVTLPTMSAGMTVTIYNITANEALLIFPAVGQHINTKAVNEDATLVHATDVSSCVVTFVGAGQVKMTAIHGTVA